MTRTRYDSFTMSLHWFIALGIIAAYAIGIIREDLPKGDFRSWLLSVHMSLGLLILGLSIVRIGWRVAAPAPAPLPMAKPMALAAKAAHLGLYLAMLAIPVIGLLAAWAKGRNLGFFGLFPIPSPFAVNKDAAKVLEEAHEVAAHLMMMLAFVHAAAAIFHQSVLKDGTLGRMLPFVRTASVAPAE